MILLGFSSPTVAVAAMGEKGLWSPAQRPTAPATVPFRPCTPVGYVDTVRT
jgi:hypothetical protein